MYISPQLTVQIHRMQSAPFNMDKSIGSSTTDHQYAYFTPGGSAAVYRYQWSTAKWDQLSPSPYINSGLVIIDGEVTTVGGYDGSRYCNINKLFTLRRGQWVEHYPPMNTVRSSPAVVSTSDGNCIFAIGGCGDWNATTIELFHTGTRNWYGLVYLPPPLPQPSATICGNQLYVIGSFNDGYSYSLQHLPSSDQPITSQSISCNVEWTQLPGLPVTNTTAATLSGQLVLVGGKEPNSMDWKISRANSIHQLIDGQWVKIGSMSSSREKCLVVTPSPDKMMIVGGLNSFGSASVEECSVLM